MCLMLSHINLLGGWRHLLVAKSFLNVSLKDMFQLLVCQIMSLLRCYLQTV